MPQDFRTKLQALLEGASRIAVLGVGSEIRGDDCAGVLVTELLQQEFGSGSDHLGVFYGGTAPENLTGEIKRFHPSHLVMVDAGDVGAHPGAVQIIGAESITGMTGSTHNLPLRVFVDYMHQSIDCEVVIVCIQPKTLEYNATLTPEVQNAAKQLAAAIGEIANSLSSVGA